MSTIEVMEEGGAPEAGASPPPPGSQSSEGAGAGSGFPSQPAAGSPRTGSGQGDKADRLPGATSTTPHSASSTPSTGSSSATNQSGSNNSSSNSNNTANSNKPAGKFKEKRPEPLDLSVKRTSATSVPSAGGFGNLFNMNTMATLETPRIVWQDNESLVSKHPRLFSSSSSSATNVRLKLSCLAGDSPPITPGSPYLDQLMMFASSASLAGYGYATGSHHSPTSLMACRSAGHYNHPVFSGYFNQPASAIRAGQLYPGQQHPEGPLSAKSFFHLSSQQQAHHLHHLHHHHHQQQQRQCEQASPLQALISAQRHFNQWQQMIDQAGGAGEPAASGPTIAAGPSATPAARDKSSFQKQMLAAYLKRAAAGNGERACRRPAGSANDKAARRSCSSDDLTAANFHNRLNPQPLAGLDKPKKNSISPLATKNLSSSSANKAEESAPSQSRFLYSGQQQAVGCEPTGSRQLSPAGATKQLSPLMNLSGDVSQSSSCESNNAGGISHRRQAPTPASVVNATENLLNIHLNSPTSSACSSSMTPMFSGASTNEVSPALPASLSEFLAGSGARASQDNDPMVLSSNYQQQQQQIRTSFGGSSSSADQRTPTAALLDKSPFSHINFLQHQHAAGSGQLHQANQQQQQQLQAVGGSLSSSATLNTPTLISPSQLKAGSICFLPSPTLSPMSSVFELPSPLLMFPPASQLQACGSSDPSTTTTTTTTTTAPAAAPPGAGANKNNNNLSNAPDDQLPTVNNNNNNMAIGFHGEHRTGSDNALSASGGTGAAGCLRQNLSENSLVHLVTSAREKLGAGASGDEPDEEFKMDVDSQETFLEAGEVAVGGGEQLARPATVLPQILVSEQPAGSCWLQHQLPAAGDQVAQSYEQHLQPAAQLGKRALSQQSLRAARSNALYQRERLESCSAPPEVYQRPASRLKSATGEHQFYSAGPAEQPRPWSAASRYQPVASQAGYYYQQQQQQPSPQYYRPLPAESARWLPAQELPGYQQSAGFGPARAEQQPWHAQTQAQQQQPNFPAGYNFSHSVQQLNTSSNNFNNPEPFKACSAPRLANAPNANNGASLELGLVGQQNSLSAGELCRQPAEATHSPNNNNPGFAPNQLQQATGPAAPLPSLSQLDQLIHHPAPMVCGANQQQSAPRFPANPSAVDQIQQQQQLRAHSADNNGLHRRPLSQAAELYAGRPASACCGSGGAAAAGPGSGSATGSGATGAAAKKYHCDQCFKAFTRSDMLTRHKRLHSGDRPFQCNECKQEFSRSDHLSTHMRTHTGEKPYKCKLCSYSACRKDMITRHMKVHNRAGGGGVGGAGASGPGPLLGNQMNLRLGRR